MNDELDTRGNPHDIDGPWLTAALEAAGVAQGATVTDVGFGGFIGTGLAARNARLHLTWDDADGRPATLVGKFPSDNPSAAAGNFASGSYRKEWVFYKYVAGLVKLRTPRCYVAMFDDAKPDFVLLMEDMSGSEQGDQLEGLPDDRLALAAAELVNLHAPRWGDTSVEAIINQGQAIQSTADAAPFIGMFYEAALPGFLTRFADRLDTDILELVQDTAKTVGRWFQGTDSPRTITHNDYRADNLLFGVADGAPPVTAVDFQSPGFGLAAVDLAYLIAGSCTDSARRAAVERGLVADYHARLTAAGVSISADDLWRDYRHGSLWGMIMSVLASMVTDITDRGEDMLTAMTQRHGRHALDLDASSLLT